jgi:hypothetical protein
MEAALCKAAGMNIIDRNAGRHRMEQTYLKHDTPKGIYVTGRCSFKNVQSTGWGIQKFGCHPPSRATAISGSILGVRKPGQPKVRKPDMVIIVD